jgi:di/tricarboxylate transporter
MTATVDLTPPRPPAPTPTVPPAPAREHGHPVVRAVAGAVIGVCVAAVWFRIDAPTEIRTTLTVFLLALAGWTLTELDDAFVALAAAVALTATGIGSTDELFATLGDSTVWLLVASFVTAAAVTASGLAARWSAAIVGRARTVGGLLWWVTAALVVTSFVVPATSGRAALAVPLFVALRAVIDDRRVVRALALLFPTIILLSAAGSLLGAGAHLITAETIERMTGERVDYLRWLVLGMPFAAASCAMSTFVISRLFLTRSQRATALVARPGDDRTTQRGATGLTNVERRVALVTLAMVVAWATTPVHGIDPAMIAVLGALVVTSPLVAAVSLSRAIDDVPWSLILFLAATLVLGESLVTSGTAEWIADALFAGLGATTSTWLIVIAIGAASLLSHLVIGSRSARSGVLTPIVVVVGLATGVDAAALAFMSTIAAGYCITLTSSAKPVAMFARVDGATYGDGDLLRLSGVLLPLHLGLIAVFSLVVWPALGLGGDDRRTPTDQRPAPVVWERSAGRAESDPTPTNPTTTDDGSGPSTETDTSSTFRAGHRSATVPAVSDATATTAPPSDAPAMATSPVPQPVEGSADLDLAVDTQDVPLDAGGTSAAVGTGASGLAPTDADGDGRHDPDEDLDADD